MLVKFEQNRMVQTKRSFELKKTKKTHFWQNVDTILEDASAAETILNYLFEDYNLSNLSVFQKLRYSLTRVTRLKVTLEHGKHDYS